MSEVKKGAASGAPSVSQSPSKLGPSTSTDTEAPAQTGMSASAETKVPPQTGMSDSTDTKVPPQTDLSDATDTNVPPQTDMSASTDVKTPAQAGMSASTDSKGPGRSMLREHEPLTRLLEMLPSQTQKGIFGSPIHYTCMHATPEYIALGTDAGQVMLFDRIALTMHKLICKKSPVVTCIRIQQGTDHVVAAGTTTGVLIIFQLPSYAPGRSKELQLFIVDDLHTSRVTCLAWSQNAVKLFSGDANGSIVCTEMDYDKSQSKSFLLSQEPHPVVQLDYAHKTLLISTTFRTVLLNMEKNNLKVQIGTKDRKILWDLGACFSPSTLPQELCVYASRPGLRLWRASSDGTVQTTFILRDLLNGTTPVIPLLEGTENVSNSGRITEKNFGHLLMLQSCSVLVTWNDGTLYLIDPTKGNFVGWHDNLGHIIDVTACQDEIYILRETPGRKIIRIALQRDHLIGKVTTPPTTLDTSQCASIEEQMAAALTREELGIKEPKPNPITSVKTQASKMSMELKAVFKGLNKKPSLADYEPPLPPPAMRPSPPVVLPPWGEAPLTRDAGDLDTCEEVDSQLTSPVTPTVVGWEQAVDDTDTSDMNYWNTSKQRTSSHSSVGSHSRTSITDDSGFYTPGAQSETTETLSGSSQESKAFTFSSLSQTAQTDDIVFASKHKKHKKKKHKHAGVKDGDTDSIASLDSEPPEQGRNGSQISEHSTTGAQNPPAAQENGDSAHSGDTKHRIRDNKRDQDNHKSKVKVPFHSQKESGSNNSLEHKSKVEVSGLNSSINNSSMAKGSSQSEKESELDSSLNRKSTAIVPAHSRKESGLDNFIEQLMEDNKAQMETVNKGEGKKTMSRSASVVVCSVDLQGMPAAPFEVSDSGQEEQTVVDEESKLDPFKMSSSHASAISSLVQGGQAVGMKASQSMPANISQPDTQQQTSNSTKNTPLPALQGMPELSIDITMPGTPEPAAAESPTDGDFYSRYLSPPMASPDDPEPSLEEALDYRQVVDDGLPSVDESPVEMSAGMDAEEHLQKYAANTWTEFLMPGNISSLSVSKHHLWITDRSDRLHYTGLVGPGLKWHKVEGYGKMVSVSPSGGLLWRVHKNQAFAAVNISLRNPAGLKWVLAAPEVSYIAVDDSVAWYVKLNGDVMVQKQLCRDRPCFRATHVPCPERCIQVSCRGSVTWVLTEYRQILVRLGITDDKPEGTDWGPLEGAENASILPSHFGLGSQGTVWVIDVVGRVWFRTGITRDKPRGNTGWWQVSSSEYLMQDSTALDMLKSVVEFPQNMAKMVSSGEQGGLIEASQHGIWLCPAFKHVLHVCRGSLLGHQWSVATPGGMATSVKWTRISAMAASQTDGMLWAQQPNNAIFCFSPDCRRPLEVPLPGLQAQFVCLAAAPGAVWGLLDIGRIFIRTGIGPHCPQGIRWVELDLTQLALPEAGDVRTKKSKWAKQAGGAKLIHISCGFQNVWAVDNKGVVYLRIGIGAPSKHVLSPAWVPVDGSTHHAGGKFIKVVTGPLDWMVWAIDNKHCVYARRGITESMPIGTHWLYIQGTPAIDMCVSKHFAYALNPRGELLVRYGICPEHCTGDYWKKIPGAFQSISVTPEDDLWGINQEQQLSYRLTHHIKKPASLTRLEQHRVSVSEDWELL